MADMPSTMSMHGDEAVPPNHETPCAIPLFGRFLSTLPRLVNDAADLVGLPGGDPATDAWFTAADQSRFATLAALEALLEAPAPDAEDRALQRVGHVFQHAMITNVPEDIARIRALLAGRRWRFRVSTAVQDAHAYNALIDAALKMLDDYLAFEEFGQADTPDPEDAPCCVEAEPDFVVATAA